MGQSSLTSLLNYLGITKEDKRMKELQKEQEVEMKIGDKVRVTNRTSGAYNREGAVSVIGDSGLVAVEFKDSDGGRYSIFLYFAESELEPVSEGGE